MRIGYIINSVEGGGAALPVPAVTRVMRDLGADVRVFALTRRDGRAISAMTASGLVVDVRAGGERDHLAALRWLNRRVRDYRPTHLWTSLTRATLLGQLVGLYQRKPVVSWQHAAYLKPANLRLLRLMCNRSVLWVGDSESVTRLTAERLPVTADRLMMWPIFAADAAAPQARPWEPGECLRIGSLGRLHPVKGYDVLIAALAHLSAQGFRAPVPFEILVGGDGSGRDALAAAVEAAGIDTLRLVGFVERPQRFLADLHLYLQPSRSEGFCIAAHEAMQAGLPLIVSAVGEMPYTVQDGICGRIIPPADPVRLASALADMLTDPGRLAAMGQAARARVLARFGPEAFRAAGAAILARLSS